jgi:ABC-type antimicrobial peptide transport system permease subunit
MGLIETMGFEVVDGRAFSPGFGAEDSKIILNEAAVRTIGFENPVGQIVNLWGDDKEVIGVIKDFNFESLKENVKPAFLKYDPDFAEKIMVRIGAQNQEETIAGIDEIFLKQTAQPMDYSFMDEDYQSLYASEQRVSKLAKYFGVMAIFLSCLGLFGLAAFTAEKRKKEIGVRKVMGASTVSILTLVSKDFVQLILISIIIAVPLAWYFADNWLKSYAYQTNLSWWIFAGSGVILMLIALMTVGFQAYKAANSNPVESLKSE